VASERIGFDDIKQTMAQLLADPRTTDGTKSRIRADAAALDRLQGIPAGSFDYSGPDGVEQMLSQRKLLAAYGGDKYEYRVAVRERDLAPIPAWRRMYGMVQEGWNAPEITIGAILNAKANVEDTIKRLSHMWTVNFNPLPPRLNVSLLVAQGRHDYCTASPLVEGHLRKRLAVGPGCTKRLCWFEESGHAPCKEEPIEFARLLTQEWRPEVAMTRCRYEAFEV
jgi:pimeloyl-ACP methyl ester carboxylesterase